MPRTRLADALAGHALSLPETWEDHPWEGDRVAKVGKKIFAFLPHDDRGSLGVKLPASAAFALSLDCVRAMAYGLGRHGWVTIDLAGADVPAAGMLMDWVTESFCAIAPKTVVRRLED